MCARRCVSACRVCVCGAGGGCKKGAGGTPNSGGERYLIKVFFCIFCADASDEQLECARLASRHGCAWGGRVEIGIESAVLGHSVPCPAP